jgi:hypothetical protein
MDGLIRVQVDPGDAAPFLARREVWFDYGGADLGEVNPVGALLPALGAVFPVAVALGVPVSALVFDSTFATAATSMADALRSMYPTFAPAGFDLLGPQGTTSHLFTAADKAVLLYSGGVTSTASLMRYAPDVECLLAVWGVDSDPEDADLWRHFRAVVAAAPAHPAAKRVLASTNVRQIIDERRLNRQFEASLGGLDWWTGVQYGITLATMAAPLSSAFSLGSVIIGSPFGVDRTGPWGSTPYLDAHIRWTAARVLHDGMEYDRQDKIREILAPWLIQGGDLSLSVCHEYSRPRGTVNCGFCERCMRTASGFLVVGQDPARVGLPVNAHTLRVWQDQMSSGAVRLSPEALAMWQSIQRSVNPTSGELLDIYGASTYLHWLAGVDLRALVRSRVRYRDDSGRFQQQGRLSQLFANPLRRRGR